MSSPLTSQHSGSGNMGPPPTYSPSGFGNMQQMSQGSIDPTDSVLPDDILDQITELTHSQNEIQQQRQHHMHHQHSVGSDAGQLSMAVNELEMAQNKINQSKKESTEAREQLRALAGKSGPEAVFRKQLSQQKKQAGGALQAKNNHGNKALARENIEKLKHAGNESNISIIRPDPPAPPIESIQPNDQSDSLLQQLLTKELY